MRSTLISFDCPNGRSRNDIGPRGRVIFAPSKSQPLRQSLTSADPRPSLARCKEGDGLSSASSGLAALATLPRALPRLRGAQPRRDGPSVPLPGAGSGSPSLAGRPDHLPDALHLLAAARHNPSTALGIFDCSQLMEPKITHLICVKLYLVCVQRVRPPQWTIS